jgi:uncharacterized protein (TIGR02246 family)
MKRNGLLLLCAALASLLTGCATTTADTHDADVKAIKDTETAWVADAASKDPAKFAAHYTDDASLLLPNAPVIAGKDGITAAVKPMLADPNFALQFQATKSDVAKSGDIGYTQGTYTMTMSDPKTKQPMTDKGKYVTIFKKQADGTWKAVSDILNSDMPLPGSEPMTK